jgi:hypothetical protein
MDTTLSKMRKAKIIFYILYFTFFVISIYFALSTNEMFKQFGMFGFLRFLKYWIVFGMLLMLGEWIIENIHIMQMRRNTKKQDAEILNLKAELYNYLHDAKKAETAKTDALEDVKHIESPVDDSKAESDTPDASQKS